MIYEVTQFGLPKNIAAGVTEALRQMQPGDTLHFPKGEYHFYKDYCQSLLVHTSNTDSFQRPKKTFGILLQDKEQLTLDGDGSVFVFHGNISALGVLRCRQITLRNFTIRYACPTNGDRQARPHGQLSSTGESALLYGRRQCGLF
jgi:hypothetical protein